MLPAGSLKQLPPPSERQRTERFRPRLEALELRDVPAICHWTGAVNSAFDNPANWYGGLPQAGDRIVFEPYLLPAPPFEEGQPPPEPTYVCHPCTGMTGATGGDGSGVYESVTLLATYTSTVTLETGFTTRAFILEGGTINQPATFADTDITVIGGFYGPLNGAFYWTGGTLNGTANLATVTITESGTTGLIAPTSGGTVELGSHIDIESGAVVTMKEGMIELLNDGIEFNIFENCSLLVDPGANKEVRPFYANENVAFGNPTWIGEGGVFQVLAGRYNGRFASVKNDGTFILEPGTIAEFGRKVPGLTGNCSFLSSGVEYIAADATLKVEFEMRKISGTIVIKCGPKPGAFEAHIIGDLNIQLGDVSYQAQGSRREWGEFYVKGNVIWDQGTYYVYIDAQNIDPPYGDVWDVIGGTFKIGGGTAVNVTAIELEGLEVPAPINNWWSCFWADNGITRTGNNDPALPPGFHFYKSPFTPSKWWRLSTEV